MGKGRRRSRATGILTQPSSLDVCGPFGQHFGHVFWQIGLEIHAFPRSRMRESQSFGVQCLSRERIEQVSKEGIVLPSRRALDGHISAVQGHQKAGGLYAACGRGI